MQIKHHKAIGEVIPENYEVKVGKDTIAKVYATIGCHSYNTIDDGEKEIKVATIDTMLSFYLAFLYGYGKVEGFTDRILCMAQFLFDVQEKNIEGKVENGVLTISLPIDKRKNIERLISLN